MPANTTPPSIDNYQVGGVTIELGSWTLDSVTGEPLVFTPVVDLGNIVSLELDPTALEVLNHFTARSGARKVDKRVITSKRFLLRVGLDEHAQETYIQYFMGDAIVLDNANEGVSILTNPLAETGIRLIYLNEDETIFTLKHNKVTVLPSGSMDMGEFDDFVGFEVEIEALYNALQTDMPNGVIEFANP